MERKVVYPQKLLPYLLVAPQIAITLVFFFWPAGQAIWMSTLLQDPLGFSVQFVGLENFEAVLKDPAYLATLQRTFLFSFGVTALAMIPALLLAVMVDRVVRGATAYRTVLVIPYAIAPAVAGALWLFLFQPSIGTIAYPLRFLGIDWNPRIDGTDAMIVVVIASAWKQIGYNFLFFLAGLQSIPKSLLEAAAIDGATEVRRFWTIVFPLLSPTTFFLLVINITYAFFDTFGVIHAVTQGGPGKSTEVLIYKAWYDGLIAQDLGRSSAQAVILMVIVIGLTVIQFRYVERRVHY
ncbi:sn-glycerol-3-phosphate ABC transporter permease UgpA [Phreatobacter oligotrophus]|jgi:sn-glycerol 3-phosphate transport system permease protein|uniref:sn-glycerol-3-phosphate transport system permease protein UgpA n=1 Tax=Phreatobacter oligotrophus TaxID=1122261 RepID=A0A2T4ZHX6_9HYPH|nr:sn-glycerol-3-phosphate ABC transporter permease UgpA [Phreatobacter oligotrophus]MBX9989659.1 sn-glycerol-3-phosphate ABC transporter permease UgpA [Phreatobacter oligotrophus]PTM61598.1 carbohydrate ABC transporter membrane protein 1 (CUT1 family) [Phreatobacter oligotrophus]